MKSPYLCGSDFPALEGVLSHDGLLLDNSAIVARVLTDS